MGKGEMTREVATRSEKSPGDRAEWGARKTANEVDRAPPFDSRDEAHSSMRMTASTARAKEVESLNRQWMQSYVNRDTGFLERYLADDYVSTFPDGAVLDKKGEIAALASGAVALTAMIPREMTVRMYGDAAVITGQSSIQATVNGEEVSGDFRFTDIWVRQSDRWLAVASQVTRIAPR
jgi:ketosteroid isomerase-like protein